MNPLKSLLSFSLIAGVLAIAPLVSAEPVTETFDGEARPANWKVQFGHWEPAEGALVCRQIEADNHGAASRWIIPMTDGVIEAKIKLGAAKAFHIGFDPKPGTVEGWKGHLYSLVISPTGANILKHNNKNDPASKAQVLAKGATKLPTAEWITVRLEAKGNSVTATVGEGIKVEATDPMFSVPKPTVVFRCIGGDAYVDEVTVDVK